MAGPGGVAPPSQDLEFCLILNRGPKVVVKDGYAPS